MKDTKTKAKNLTHQDKMRIFNMFNSGHCYQTEICREYNITKQTMIKVVYEIKNLIESELR